MRRRHNYSASGQRGFTLLEVIVALAVLSIALAAVIKGVGSTVGNMSYLRDRTLAHWVGMNKIVESQVRRDWPSPEKTEGKTAMGEREWHWKITMIKTPDPNVRRMEIEVRAGIDDKQALERIVSYLGKPQQGSAEGAGLGNSGDEL